MFTTNKKTHRGLIFRIGLIALAIPLVCSRANGAAGDLFVTDLATNSIVVYSTDGTQRTFATGLSSPQGLAFDPTGNLYVADKGTGNIYKYAADASRTTFASGLSGPVGLAYSNLSNDLLVSENTGNQVSSLAKDGSVDSSFTIASPLGIAFRNITKAGSTNPDVNTTWIVSNPDPVNSFIQEDIAGGATNMFLSGLDPRAVTFTPDPFTGDYASAYISCGDSAGSVYVVSTMMDSGGNLINNTSMFASSLGDVHGVAFLRSPFDPVGTADLYVADTAGSKITKITPPPTMATTTFVAGGNPNYLAFETILAGKVQNISTRGQVLTGDNVLIVGFIITGDSTTSKAIILRGIGPSLSSANPPVTDALANPYLELHYPDGTVKANDNWMDNSADDIATLMAADNGALVPTDPNESAIVATLAPGEYTAILSGVGGTTGVGMVEAYDTNSTDTGELGNVSTRGYVSSSDDVLIGGFILGPTNEAARMLIRALGPELTASGVSSVLADPVVTLYDSNANILSSNDNWADTAQGEITATGLAPTNANEAAILANLPAGAYTAIVSGKSGATGVALVEAYHVP